MLPPQHLALGQMADYWTISGLLVNRLGDYGRHALNYWKRITALTLLGVGHGLLVPPARLAPGELTVGEITQVLKQSQPRVSRHLKLYEELAAGH